jgi:DNA-binding protein YbaB
MMGEFERQREKMHQLQEKMKSVSGTGRSPLGLVTATVGSQGELTGITFNPRDVKRARPEQLSEEVLAAVRAARADAMGKLAEVMPPSPFSGTSFSDLASGKTDLASLLPDPSTLLSARPPGSARRSGPADDEWDEGGA